MQQTALVNRVLSPRQYLVSKVGLQHSQLKTGQQMCELMGGAEHQHRKQLEEDEDTGRLPGVSPGVSAPPGRQQDSLGGITVLDGGPRRSPAQPWNEPVSFWSGS